MVNWAIIGPGTIAHNFADGLAQVDNARLVAIAGRDLGRCQLFGARYSLDRRNIHINYKLLLADPNVDAVYVATPHSAHEAIVMDAIGAGKHVLVEKPAAISTGAVRAMVKAARQRKLLFMEGYMYLCHPQIARLVDLLKQGAIGAPVHIAATFGHAAVYEPDSRLFLPELGGGAIWDVGGYPLSLARLIAGVVAGAEFAEPIHMEWQGELAPTGVDQAAFAKLSFDTGFIAEIGTSISRELENNVVITGSKGKIILPDPWVPGRNKGPSDSRILIVDESGNQRIEDIRDDRQLFAFEASAASRAIAAGHIRADFPAMSGDQSVAQIAAQAKWRAAID